MIAVGALDVNAKCHAALTSFSSAGRQTVKFDVPSMRQDAQLADAWVHLRQKIMRKLINYRQVH